MAKDSNFDTMHPLNGQGVHFWLSKAAFVNKKLSQCANKKLSQF